VIDLELKPSGIMVGAKQEKEEVPQADRVFLDIEGSLGYVGDILQLAWMVTDWQFNIKSADSRYYRNSQPIEPEAQRVHKLSEEFLWSVSDTYFTLDYFNLEFLFPTVPTMYIIYNHYDIIKMQNEANKSSGGLEFGQLASSLSCAPQKVCHWDAIAITGRKLMTSLSEADNKRVAITKAFVENKFGIESKGPHDAMYDVIALYELCRGWLGGCI
jgi:DNA polymerase III epsilon subunit-like protein